MILDSKNQQRSFVHLARRVIFALHQNPDSGQTHVRVRRAGILLKIRMGILLKLLWEGDLMKVYYVI